MHVVAAHFGILCLQFGGLKSLLQGFYPLFAGVEVVVELVDHAGQRLDLPFLGIEEIFEPPDKVLHLLFHGGTVGTVL